MPKCAVKKCKNNTLTTRKKDGVSYFRFPINEIDREKWRTIIATERGEELFKPNNSSVVCSNHFLENDFYFTKCGRRKVKKNILPRVEKIKRENEDEKKILTAVNDRRPPSPTSSGVTSIVDSPKTPTSSGVTSIVDLPKTPTSSEVPLIVNSPKTPTSPGVTSIIDSPKTSAYIKSLNTCQKFIELRNRQIINLKKKNKRLKKKCLNLKETVADLKKKLRVNKPLSTTPTTNLNEFTIIRDILTAKRKVPFGTCPPDLRKFALKLHSHSPEAYNYLRKIFPATLPHRNTLLRWQKNVQCPDPNFVIVQIPEIS